MLQRFSLADPPSKQDISPPDAERQCLDSALRDAENGAQFITMYLMCSS